MTDDLTLIPGDALADLLTGGWIGPAEFLQYRTWYAGALLRPTCGYISRPGHGDDIASYSPENIRLNLLRPESLDHVARVLAQGLRCPMRVGAECGENIAAGEWIAYGSPSHPLRVVPPVCPRCAGSGWLRKPAPIYHLTDAARTNALSPLVIAQAAGWSVRNVARGGEGLADVALDWIDESDDDPLFTRASLCRPSLSAAAYVSSTGWRVYPVGGGFIKGPETGPEGRAAADRAAHEHLFATLDNGVATFPEIPNV